MRGASLAGCAEGAADGRICRRDFDWSVGPVAGQLPSFNGAHITSLPLPFRQSLEPSYSSSSSSPIFFSLFLLIYPSSRHPSSFLSLSIPLLHLPDSSIIIMRLSTSALVLGAASTAVGFQDQQVLGGGSSSSSPGKTYLEMDLDIESWAKPLEEMFGKVSSEAKAIWDEVSLLAPEAVEAFKKQAMSTKPKKSSRRPDSKWDHVVKGADVQALWAEKDGESHRQIGGKLDNYNLRTKKVDPAKLGVDKVKQYSGYLDDEEEDKHLFYCKLTIVLNVFCAKMDANVSFPRVLRVSQ